MIQSFGDKDTQRLFQEERPRKLPNQIWRIACRKLLLIDAAADVTDLRSPPGNHLEKLGGNLKDFHSIRQWWVIFRWEENGPHEVEIIDYH